MTMPYTVHLCERNEVEEFIETLHYSHNINGVMCKYVFKMTDGAGDIVGAMLYGGLGMANAWKKYANCPEDVIELRRLVLIDNTKRNAESYFIGHTLRWLKRHTNIKYVISYADPNHGHIGVIYKASNFECLGKTSKGRVINYNGRLYHDKAIRTKYKGELKPFAVKLKQALENGEAFYINTQPKIIYKYTL